MEIDENIEKLPFLMAVIAGIFTIILHTAGNAFDCKFLFELGDNSAVMTGSFAIWSYFSLTTKKENEMCKILYSEGEDEE